jgi:hypothetical protein
MLGVQVVVLINELPSDEKARPQAILVCLEEPW